MAPACHSVACTIPLHGMMHERALLPALQITAQEQMCIRSFGLQCTCHTEITLLLLGQEVSQLLHYLPH